MDDCPPLVGKAQRFFSSELGGASAVGGPAGGWHGSLVFLSDN